MCACVCGETERGGGGWGVRVSEPEKGCFIQVGARVCVFLQQRALPALFHACLHTLCVCVSAAVCCLHCFMRVGARVRVSAAVCVACIFWQKKVKKRF